MRFTFRIDYSKSYAFNRLCTPFVVHGVEILVPHYEAYEPHILNEAHYSYTFKNNMCQEGACYDDGAFTFYA